MAAVVGGRGCSCSGAGSGRGAAADAGGWAAGLAARVARGAVEPYMTLAARGRRRETAATEFVVTGGLLGAGRAAEARGNACRAA